MNSIRPDMFWSLQEDRVIVTGRRRCLGPVSGGIKFSYKNDDSPLQEVVLLAVCSDPTESREVIYTNIYTSRCCTIAIIITKQQSIDLWGKTPGIRVK